MNSQLHQVDEHSTIASLLFFVTAATLYIFLPCFHGSELQIASENLSATVFYLDWRDEPKKFKTALKIFMENTKKPMKIAVFKVFHVNLQNFQFIVHSAYSIYAVLKFKQ
jgi:hypothetical protein